MHNVMMTATSIPQTASNTIHFMSMLRAGNRQYLVEERLG
jgi:hypothetical protein